MKDPKVIGAIVQNGRVEVAVPGEWVDGSEVHVYLECRANLTAESSPINGAELALVWDLMVQEETRARDDDKTVKPD
jgi:hypothetical protein